MEAMRQAYRGTRLRLDGNLSALLARMQDAVDTGTPLTASWLSQEARYRELLRQVEDELQELGQAQAPGIASAQEDAARIAVDSLPRFAEAALGTPPPDVTVTWNVLPASRVEAIVGLAGDGTPLANVLSEWGTDIAAKVRDELVTGIALGTPVHRIAKNLSALVGTVKDGDIEKPGLALSRAETLVRTEFHRAAREATRSAYEWNADLLDGWTWVAACDDRCCACCWAMHGTHHTLADSLNGHPSCRCVMAPRTKSWGAILGDSSLPDTRPSIETGDARFAKLGEDAQKAILGPGLFERYAAGTITLSDCVAESHHERWGSHRRVATLAEAESSAAQS